MNSPKTVRGEVNARDLQVIRWIARGKERNEVASILQTSRPAINRHLAKLKNLTGSANTTQTVAALMALGLLTAADVMDAPVWERQKMAETIAPDLTAHSTLTAPDVVAYLGGQQIPKPDGEAEEHINWCIGEMSREWSERTGARFRSIPQQREGGAL